MDIELDPNVAALKNGLENQPLSLEELAEPHFQSRMLPDPQLGIWVMGMSKNKPVLPWWSYSPEIDEDIHSLNKLFHVPNAQAVFDVLFLNEILQLGGRNLYVVFTGNIRTETWTTLRQEEKDVFNRGQRIVYYLEAINHKTMSISWAPYYQPQSMVRDPRFGSLWRLFQAMQEEDDLATSISFISISDPAKLPEAIQTLIKQNDNRSLALADHVDFFGAYSSPIKSNASAMCALYAKTPEWLEKLKGIQPSFMRKYQAAKEEMLKNPHPRTVTKILTRYVIF